MNHSHLVALGDSLIAGIGDSVDGPIISFAELFAAELRKTSPAMQYTSFAQGGATSQDVVNNQLQSALALQPDLMLILVGANDVMNPTWNPETTRANLATIFESITARNIPIVSCNYADGAAILGPKASQWVRMGQPRIKQVCDMLREFGQQYSTTFLDTWALSHHFEANEWSLDGVHPNTLGHRKAAQFLIGGQ